ncbi:hypothetical protein [Agaribacter marinus]|uniref:hypothetical protein n=1 Tax=Agaribacter marinus TaxID=1431249 RepID=UPI0024E112BB|nr:hypothetical protein [Agaribacter marinus]
MNIETVLVGLIGVFVGVILNTFKDLYLRKRTEKIARTYLSIQISALLHNFIYGCLDVVNDNGLYEGKRDESGCLRAQVDTPKFEPMSVEVDWTTLPPKLMQKLLQFPSDVEYSNIYISEVWEYAATPPNWDEFFEARIEKFAPLGVTAISLIKELEAVSNVQLIDDKAISEIKKRLDLEIEKVEKAMRVRDAQNAENLSKLSTRESRNFGSI